MSKLERRRVTDADPAADDLLPRCAVLARVNRSRASRSPAVARPSSPIPEGEARRTRGDRRWRAGLRAAPRMCASLNPSLNSSSSTGADRVLEVGVGPAVAGVSPGNASPYGGTRPVMRLMPQAAMESAMRSQRDHRVLEHVVAHRWIAAADDGQVAVQRAVRDRSARGERRDGTGSSGRAA